MKYRIDEALYVDAPKEREREWKHALMDLNADANGQPPQITLVRRADGGIDFVIEAADGAIATAELPYPKLKSSFRDYRDIIMRLSRADGGSFGMRDWETLDYAKKLVHDEAGELIQETLEPHAPLTHPTARRLFTLAFLISSDLPEELVRNHRRHGPPK